MEEFFFFLTLMRIRNGPESEEELPAVIARQERQKEGQGSYSSSGPSKTRAKEKNVQSFGAFNIPYISQAIAEGSGELPSTDDSDGFGFGRG